MQIRFLFDEFEFRRLVEDILLVSAFEPNDEHTRKWLSHNTKLILDKYILNGYSVVCDHTNNDEYSMIMIIDVSVTLPTNSVLSFRFSISPVDLLPK